MCARVAKERRSERWGSSEAVVAERACSQSGGVSSFRGAGWSGATNNVCFPFSSTLHHSSTRRGQGRRRCMRRPPLHHRTIGKAFIPLYNREQVCREQNRDALRTLFHHATQTTTTQLVVTRRRCRQKSITSTATTTNHNRCRHRSTTGTAFNNSTQRQHQTGRKSTVQHLAPPHTCHH